jgi:hypothetical protein
MTSGALSVSRRQATAATFTPADLDMPGTGWRLTTWPQATGWQAYLRGGHRF